MKHFPHGSVASLGDGHFVFARDLTQAGDVTLQAQHPGLSFVGFSRCGFSGLEDFVDLANHIGTHLKPNGIGSRVGP